jgi:molybdopterin molybdotransferase
MTALLPVAEAQARILGAIAALPSEMVPLRAALGRVLAQDARARRSQPPADLSAMDGYAVRSADLAKLPARLEIVDSIPAGATPQRDIGSGHAARIFTGAFVPRGADMIVIQENATPEAGGVVVREGEARPGQHIRRAGSDFQDGETCVSAGRKLVPRDLALLSAMDLAAIPVVRRPKIAILATGDELVRAGAPRGPAQIVAASLDGLIAQVENWGADPIDLGIARDQAADIAAAAAGAQEADMLVTLGGASVGDHDLVRAGLGADGLALDFWKIAMRPGKPLMFGAYRGKPFLGLPGNPVSALVCSLLFLKPAVMRLAGDRSPPHRMEILALDAPLSANDQRQDYVRAKIVEGRVRPWSRQDSGELKPLAHADVLIVRPPFDVARDKGDRVDVLLLDEA